MSFYVLSAGAEVDLDEIWELIALDSLDAADRWIDNLFKPFGRIARNIGIGHARKGLTSHPVLFWPVDAYWVI